MKSGILLSAAAVLLLAFVQISCGSNSTVVANPTTAKFLVAVDGNQGLGGNNVNVFPVNSTTGALGAAVSGSPFNMGLTDGMTLAVHPNGRFVYAADGVDGSIHSWSVSETTGVPTQIAAPVINESGSFSEICCGPEDAATHVLTITANGNFLFSANNDATVGAYKINADGSLAHIADLNLVGACATGGIDANNSFVWVVDNCPSNSGPWNIWTMSIGATGALTNASSVALTGVTGFLWSVQVNPANFVYAGNEGAGGAALQFLHASRHWRAHSVGAADQ